MRFLVQIGGMKSYIFIVILQSLPVNIIVESSAPMILYSETVRYGLLLVNRK